MTTRDKGSSSDNQDSENYALPWLVNNSLPEHELKEIEANLKGSKELQQDKAFLEALRQHVKSQDLPQAPRELAWQRLKRDIHSEQKQNRIQRFWRPAAIAASLILIAQTVFIVLPNTEHSGYEMASSVGYSTVLRIKFHDAATASDIQHLLLQYDLRVIDGPSAAGLYTVTSAQINDKTADTLRNHSKIIAHVQNI